MKKFTVLFFVLISLQGSYAQSPLIQGILNTLNQDSLIYFDKELSGLVPANINGSPYTILSRNKYQPGNDMATQYIKNKLDYYGLTTTIQTFSSTGKNIYGVKTGTLYPNKKYMICAHMDDMPSGTIAPGADDNGSGTAAVIEIARILKNYDSPYTLVFALWDEEEQGLVGSDYYANQASLSGDSIMGVLNMDMIAYDSNNDNHCEVHTRAVGSSLTLSATMVQCNTDYNLGLVIAIKNPGITASDHASFWYRNYGAILLIEDYTSNFNNKYHTVGDTLGNCNIPYFVKMTKLTAAAFCTLIQVHNVPVELVMFKAEASSDQVRLNWYTSTETNNRGFSVERKYENETEWNTIGFVEGKGTTTETSVYSFTDSKLKAGKYYYRLKQIDLNGAFEYSKVAEAVVNLPSQFVLEQNYPNPFNPSTTIGFEVPVPSHVVIKIYDMLGKEISEVLNETKAPGKYHVNYDASGLSNGIYFYRIETEGFQASGKMILMK